MSSNPPIEEYQEYIRELKNRLRNNEENYRYLLNSLNDAVFIAGIKEDDMPGLFLYVNKSACLRYGYSRKEFLKMGPEDLDTIKWADVSKESEFIRGFRKQKKMINEMIHLTKDGSKINVELNSKLIKFRDKPAVITIARDITARKQAQKKQEKLIKDLQKALSEIKTLRGILPICSHCKKIRDDKGYWNQVEVYIHSHSGAQFSHGICPECAGKYYSDFDFPGKNTDGFQPK